MKWTTLACLVAGLVAASVAYPEGSSDYIVGPVLVPVDRGVQCPEIKKPKVPNKVPAWAQKSFRKLRKQKYEEIPHFAGRGDTTKAFRNGRQIVMKLCSDFALNSVVHYTRVTGKRRNPVFDIFFDCKQSHNWTIELSRTLQFGSGLRTARGIWRLIAPHLNVAFDGRKQRRIMKINSLAQVTAYGITFRNGATVKLSAVARNKIPHGGWSGAAVFIGFHNAKFTAVRCRFMNNKALSWYARYGGGGAIKVETRSTLIAYRCHFEGNIASSGGAISASSSHFVKVAESTFYHNEARGGGDGSAKNKPSKNLGSKPQILAMGGAVRIDSVTDHSNDNEHVTFCNCHFKSNHISISTSTLWKQFNYNKRESQKRLRASGTAINAWSKASNLKGKGVHFLLMKGCKFTANSERVSVPGPRSGNYAVEIEGGGHITILGTKFERNGVNGAVLKVDNSRRYNKIKKKTYKTTLQNLTFVKNPVTGLDFGNMKYKSSCKVLNVQGMKNGKGQCARMLK